MEGCPWRGGSHTNAMHIEAAHLSIRLGLRSLVRSARCECGERFIRIHNSFEQDLAVMAAPLALDFRAHGQSAGWRKGEDLIDALPYVDSMAPETKKQVEALIEEELKRSTKKPADYLREMPAVPSNLFEGHPLLAAEYER